MFNLTGLNGSVKVDGQTVTVKSEELGAKPVVMAADSIGGVFVWTGVGAGQFAVQFKRSGRGNDSVANEFAWIRFNSAHKEWWDAMASAIMNAVHASGRAGGTTPDKAAAKSGGKPAAKAAGKPAGAAAAKTTDKAATAADKAADSAEATSPTSFDSWLTRTLGLDAQQRDATTDR